MQNSTFFDLAEGIEGLLHVDYLQTDMHTTISESMKRVCMHPFVPW